MIRLPCATIYVLILATVCWGDIDAQSGQSIEPTSEIPDRREFPVSQSIDPCGDFFEYACSEVNARFELREDRSRHIFSFSDSAERILNAKKEYLAGLSKRSKLSQRALEIRDYYQACMDHKARAAEEKELVRAIQTEVEALPSREAFAEFLGQQIMTPKYSFLGFASSPNPEDSNWLDVYLSGGSLMSLPERSYYQQPTVLQAYEQVVQHFFETVGSSDAQARAKKVVAFEKAYAEVYPLPAEWRQLWVQKEWVTANALQQRYPNLKLGTFLSKKPERTRIRHYTDSYFGFLDKALQETDLAVLKDTYLYHAASGLMDDAYPEFFKRRFEFRHKYLGGPPQRPERQERCTRRVMSDLGHELDAELVDEFFPGFDQQKFESLVDRVRQVMVRRLRENKWLSSSGRDAALRKMTSTSMMLVKPKRAQDWDFNLPADYHAKRPLSNQLLLREKRIQRTLERLTKPRNKQRWGMGPMTVNAYYSPYNNQFVMPIGILQYPFYDGLLPEHANLGAVGVVVGHELGHAIDDKGSKFDENGSLKQWMTAEDREMFKSRTQRLAALYEQACYEGLGEGADQKMCHDGQLTLGENIGDLTGVSFAFDAVKYSTDPVMKKQQMREFFTQYARVWCGTMRPKERMRRLKTDPHALPEARVNEVVKHHSGFYDAFQCTEEDAMYLAPESRVKVW